MNRKMNFTTTKNDFDNVLDDYTELMNSKYQWVETKAEIYTHELLTGIRIYIYTN